MLGLAFKFGAIPAHDSGARRGRRRPAPAAAFLTVASKFEALVALGRLALILPEDRVGWRLLVAVLAAATMILGNLARCGRTTCAACSAGRRSYLQAGYGLMAVVALGRSDMAVATLLYFLAAYAAANLAAFAVVVELRGRTERASYAGLASAQPVLALVLVVSFWWVCRPWPASSPRCCCTR